MRAILSVSDKTGIQEFAAGLVELGWEIYSTGNTEQLLRAAGVPARPIRELTGFPEILGGRVKTLHPGIHAGILARRALAADVQELEAHGLKTIDLVAVNLYPFAAALGTATSAEQELLEQIDIGGVTLLRAAAKNYHDVTVVVDPQEYPLILAELRERGETSPATRRRLAARAFAHTAAYDALIAQWFACGPEAGLAESPPFPEIISVPVEKLMDLRYGENPHQRAAFYCLGSRRLGLSGLAAARQLHGKELSYNNLLDLDAAWSAASDFAAPTVVIIKHTNPCGLASHESLAEAFRRAYSGDPISAYGGIIGANRPIDGETAALIAETFFECIIAPGYAEDALQRLKRKRNLRIMEMPQAPLPVDRQWWARVEVRQVRGGLLIQTPDALPEDAVHLKVVTQREPTHEELTNLLFAWRAVKHVKSNAIVLAKDLQVVGVGAGQQSRVDSVDLAVRKAGERAVGSVLASDAFFPKVDGVEHAIAAGVTAIIQPGGSIADEDVIRVADRHRIAMVFTGVRHFRH
jgi:phosphoribosylaminoimidazolecarboxamide formyltransferase/IMP cyclohydrolase